MNRPRHSDHLMLYTWPAAAYRSTIYLRTSTLSNSTPHRTLTIHPNHQSRYSLQCSGCAYSRGAYTNRLSRLPPISLCNICEPSPSRTLNSQSMSADYTFSTICTDLSTNPFLPVLALVLAHLFLRHAPLCTRYALHLNSRPSTARISTHTVPHSFYGLSSSTTSSSELSALAHSVPQPVPQVPADLSPQPTIRTHWNVLLSKTPHFNLSPSLCHLPLTIIIGRTS